MRTSAPDLLPMFRSDMQVDLLGMLLLQPDRTDDRAQQCCLADTVATQNCHAFAGTHARRSVLIVPAGP